MGTPFTHALRVRYHECDAQGIVFNANYLTYFDVAMTEFWREAVGSYEQLLESGLDTIVAEAGIRYRAPLRFDDEAELALRVSHMGTTSLVFSFAISRGPAAVAEGEVRYVMVNAADHAKTPIPDDLRKKLNRFA